MTVASSERVFPQVRTPSSISSARIRPCGSTQTWPGRMWMSLGVRAVSANVYGAGPRISTTSPTPTSVVCRCEVNVARPRAITTTVSGARSSTVIDHVRSNTALSANARCARGPSTRALIPSTLRRSHMFRRLVSIPILRPATQAEAMTILITGGTGKTGSRVAHRLSALGRPVRAVSRHSEPRFDWLDDSTWEGALTGCTSAYLTFQPDIGLPGADVILGAFSRRAVAFGCTRLVLLSGRGEDAARQAEAAFIAAGAEWTILRSAFFFQNFTEAFSAEEIAAGSLTMVEITVGEPFVDADDLADVAVATLLDPVHIGRIHELTGPRLITFGDIAGEISSAIGRPVTFRELSAGHYIAALVSAGLAREDAVGLAHLFEEVLDGRNAHLESGIRDVLGREPRDFTAFVRSALAESASHG